MPDHRIVLLGTGNAFNSDARASQAVLVLRENGSFLIDCGPTIGYSMEKAAIDTNEIEKVFFTHLHGDHVAGWPFLYLRMLFLDGRTKPLEVVGPTGTKKCLESLLEICYGEIASSEKATFEVSYRELDVEAASGIDCGGVTVDTIPVEHHPSSIALIFQLGEVRFGISGDTAWCPGVEDLIGRCDVLLLECTVLELDSSRHIALSEVREHASLFSECSVFLVHVHDEIREALEAEPIDNVQVAADRTELTFS